MSITKNIQSIRSEISPSITLVAVTKNRTAEEIKEAVRAGVTDIGESRLRELPEFPQNITKHFIGRLQSNKVREVVRSFDMIQSVDRLKLAQKIDEECRKIDKIMPVLIQVNTSDEPQKGGVPLSDAGNLIKEVSKFKNIQLRGLMTLAVRSDDENKIRSCFKKLKQLFDQIKNSSFELRSPSFNVLSMGMSEDYRIAIEEGATMIRLGRGVFED
ncbi:YggS family pyridoxal phosphate-dependent enzyme [Candidatus Peregrinibacteria bacterium]|nr:YggS family pyridoxal phosphate-dependent enzyme [Candidatus Peregrinibacteria bacterium]